MSLLDRDYYRDEDSPSWSEWLDAHGAAFIIGVICSIFLLQLFSAPRGSEKLTVTTREELREKYADLRESRADPIRKHTDLYLPAVLSGEVWRIVTAFWVHEASNLIGVVLGMVVIYLTGKMLEPILGGKEFIAFYCYTGVFVMLGMFLGKWLGKSVFANVGAWPFEPAFGACGSTGSITALLVLFALKYWDQPTRFFNMTLPSWMAVAIVLGISLVLSLSAPDRGDLFAANVLGALAAWLYHRMGIRIIDKIMTFSRSTRSGRTPQRLQRLKIVPPLDATPSEHDENAEDQEGRYKQQVVIRANVRDNTGVIVDEQLEAKLDRVLDKVAKSGTDSLSSEEMEILLKASEVYKRRRSS
ncbi:MAG: rhomboid family intramembrane serine protease [Gemmataceae bacterium]